MRKQRTAANLSENERNLILNIRLAVTCGIADEKYMDEIVAELNVHEDTVRLVLEEDRAKEWGMTHDR